MTIKEEGGTSVLFSVIYSRNRFLDTGVEFVSLASKCIFKFSYLHNNHFCRLLEGCVTLVLEPKEMGQKKLALALLGLPSE
jgi:hypothetical protein